MTQSVFEEAMVKTLAVMTKADTNIHAVEVATVQKVLAEELGHEMSSGDVRVAAHDEFIEGRSIAKFLKKKQGDLSLDEKKRIMKALVEVVKADDRTSPAEAEMFNDVAAALQLTAADLVNL